MEEMDKILFSKVLQQLVEAVAVLVLYLVVVIMEQVEVVVLVE